MSDVINGVLRDDLKSLLVAIEGTMWSNAQWAVRFRALLSEQPQAKCVTCGEPTKFGKPYCEDHCYELPPVSTAPQVGAGCFVQPVPNHCDRITWKGLYYHLPDGVEQASAAQSAPSTGIYSSDPLACSGCASGCFRCKNDAQSAPDEREAVTMQQVLTAYEYATEHPHKYLRGTTNWCAAFAHSLNEQLGAAWQRAQSAPVVPDGWRLVPVEPTDAMLAAYEFHAIAPMGPISVYGYRAMLAAASKVAPHG